MEFIWGCVLRGSVIQALGEVWGSDIPGPSMVFNLEWKFKKYLMRKGVLSEVPKDPEIIN